MKLFRFNALLLAALAWGAPARAQAADTSAITSALWTACPGATVRVAVRSGEPVTGRCGEVLDGRLLVRMEGAERQVPLIDVDSLWVQRSMQTEATVVLAVLAGAAGGFYANSQDPGECFAYGCDGERLVATLRGAAIGALGGAALGVIVGPRLTRWRRRHP